MPWHLRDDMRRFKQLTIGHPVMMGRATFDSIGRPLPGRPNVVVTRDPGWVAEGVHVTHSIEGALAAAGALAERGEVMVIGGGQVYAGTVEHARRLEITHVDVEVEAPDAWFPPIDPTRWAAAATDQRDGFSWVTYERRSGEA